MAAATRYGERLVVERGRIGLSRAQLADGIGVLERLIEDWETGAALLPIPALVAMGVCGVDRVYVATGQRFFYSMLTDGERIVLANFHAAPAQMQAEVWAILAAFAPVRD